MKKIITKQHVSDNLTIITEETEDVVYEDNTFVYWILFIITILISIVMIFWGLLFL